MSGDLLSSPSTLQFENDRLGNLKLFSGIKYPNKLFLFLYFVSSPACD